MTLNEYINSGGEYYHRVHDSEAFWNLIIKGLGYDRKPSDTSQQEVQDIKDGKALVLCPTDKDAKQIVRVFYPKFKGWKKNPKLSNYRELTVEEIFNDKEPNRK